MTQVWLCGACRSLNDIRNRVCYRCQAKRSRTELVPDGALPVGLGTGTLPKDPSLFGAIIVGTAAALVALALWVYTEPGIRLFQGRVAWVIGVIIGVAVVLGGRGRASLLSIIVSFLLTTATVVAGEYLIISASLASASRIVVEGVPVAPPDAVLEGFKTTMSGDPIRPLLWLLAIAAGTLIPWRALTGDDPDPEA